MKLPDGMYSLLKTLGLHRRELRAWAMYEWAITGFYAVMLVALFPIYFESVAAANYDGALTATQLYALLTTVALSTAAFISPILGAITDYIAVKKRLLATFASLGVVAVAGMYFIHEGDLVLASILFIAANIGANTSRLFYDAILPHIASEEEMDRVSTAGWAVGYMGATIILVLVLILVLQPEWFGFAADSTLPARLSFLGVALWWGSFTIPLLRVVDEPPLKIEETDLPVRQAVRLGLQDLKRTFERLRTYRNAFIFLVAFFIYNDGIGTIIRMAAAYGSELGIEQWVVMGSVVLVQVVAIPFTFLFGYLAGKIGTKPAIFIGLFVYMGISVLGFFMTHALHFAALAFLVGMVQGGTQALSRGLFASMIPRFESGQFFGFYAVFERFSGIFGPAVFAAVGLAAGAMGMDAESSRPAILAVILFFIIGAVLLTYVDVDEGRQVARDAERKLAEKADIDLSELDQPPVVGE